MNVMLLLGLLSRAQQIIDVILFEPFMRRLCDGRRAHDHDAMTAAVAFFVDATCRYRDPSNPTKSKFYNSYEAPYLFSGRFISSANPLAPQSNHGIS